MFSILWWVNTGWMSGAHQSRSITLLLSWTGERKYNERLMGWDKDGEITDQILSQENRLNLGKN